MTLSHADHAGFTEAGSRFAATTQRVLTPADASLWRRQLLSEPGTVSVFDVPLLTPPGLSAAMAAVAVSVFDYDTRFWLSPSADSRLVRGFLNRTARGQPVSELTFADYALIARPGERSAMRAHFCGSSAQPAASTTLILQVDDLRPDGPWVITGPRVRGARRLEVRGLGRNFLDEWAGNAKLAPRGVDLILVSGCTYCYLPRSTRIDVLQAGSSGRKNNQEGSTSSSKFAPYSACLLST